MLKMLSSLRNTNVITNRIFKESIYALLFKLFIVTIHCMDTLLGYVGLFINAHSNV